MLDFHYSDTWADPAKQWTPAAWKDLSDEELYQKIYDYTKETLGRLKEEGITPAFIQPGNEISYGMLWGPVGTPEGDLKKALMGSNDNSGKAGSALKTLCRFADPNAGILEIGADNAAMWYDLSGYPVSNPRQQGIYIRNGRKVMHSGK